MCTALVVAIAALGFVGTGVPAPAAAHLGGVAGYSRDVPLPAFVPVVPATLHIPVLGVNAPVRPVGTISEPAPFLGAQPVSTFAVPHDGATVGWWSDGPMVGAPGMAILLGHTMVGGAAVFNRLAELHPGDTVTVDGPPGAAPVELRITHLVVGIPKSDPHALQQVLAGNAAGARLALITCGGEFEQAYRASADNIVAFATIA